MGRYLINRLGGLLFVIVALVVFTFFATNVLGDPIALLTDPETTSAEDIARLRAANGLDRNQQSGANHSLLYGDT